MSSAWQVRERHTATGRMFLLFKGKMWLYLQLCNNDREFNMQYAVPVLQAYFLKDKQSSIWH